MKIRKSEGLNNFIVMKSLFLEEEKDHWQKSVKVDTDFTRKKGNNYMYTQTILDKILDKNNMNDAYKQVVKNKGSAGVDGMTLNEVGGYLATNREEIIEAIRERKYKPQPVLRVEIPKPNGGVRLLGIPTVVDRVIQQAIAQVLTPMFDSQFSDNSYGFRPKRYAEMAILKALDYMNGVMNGLWILT